MELLLITNKKGGMHMHEDFRLNLIRMTLLKEAESNHLHLDQLDVLFEDKGLGSVSRQLIHDQLEHLQGEAFLKKLSATEYQLSNKGRTEIDLVKTAIDKF